MNHYESHEEASARGDYFDRLERIEEIMAQDEEYDPAVARRIAWERNTAATSVSHTTRQATPK